MPYMLAGLLFANVCLTTVEKDKRRQVWYGPCMVTEPVAFKGNPYDPAENDVEVDFLGAGGRKFRRMGYYVGDGKFAATLVAPVPGEYRPVFSLNGKEVPQGERTFAVRERLPHGFIGLNGRRFAWSDGTPYFPIGYDYGWRQIPNESVAQGMKKMGKQGANWSRIWANYWDEKNPYWPAKGQTLAPGELLQGPLQTWDGIIAAAESADVHFQFVLFHHGAVSTTTDSNWRDHPWNAANGGFLKDPADFFSDPEAKRRTKIWLRYAVARYAHSPAVMAWELFNEVQWVDAIKKEPSRVGDVAAWHKEMADYVRGIDPYHHLITSSSSESLDSHVFDAVDYMQPHTYPVNVLASIGGYRFEGKPGFFGEFGPPAGGRESVRKLVRDGIYGGILAGHAGAGEYWFWDNVDRSGLGSDFLAARKVIDGSGLLHHPDAKPLTISADTPNHGDMLLAAGRGWGKSSTFELDLPKVGIQELAGWSQYFQSIDNGQPGWGKPFLLRFVAPAAGKLQIGIGQVSDKGATLAVWVNDQKVLDQKFDPPAAGARSGRRGATPISVDFPAGPVNVRIENHGGDWIRMDSITVPGVGPTAFAHGLGDRRWALVRVVGPDTSSVTVTGLPLADGSYRAKVWDVATGAETILAVKVVHGAFTAEHLPPDGVLAIS